MRNYIFCCIIYVEWCSDSTLFSPYITLSVSFSFTFLFPHLRKYYYQKRSALRKKLKLVQKKYDEANEDMLVWEEKSIQKITRNKKR